MPTADRAGFSIEAVDLQELRNALDKKQGRLGAFQNTFGKAVTLIDQWIQKNFEQEGRLAYPGAGWKPLAASTLIARLKRGKKSYIKSAALHSSQSYPSGAAGVRILQDKGWLKSRWRHFWNNQYAIIESGVDYGIYHDSDQPRRKIPERKITPTEKQIMPELVKIFGNHVRTSLDKR